MRAWRAHRAVLAARGGRRRGAASRARSGVEFYRHFEHVLSRHGLLRAAGQTPREFALAAGAQLVRRSGRAELAPLAVEVVEAFYRVRFGGQPLDPQAEQTVELGIERSGAAP